VNCVSQLYSKKYGIRTKNGRKNQNGGFLIAVFNLSWNSRWRQNWRRFRF
jgi:hypothetical protein